MRKWNGWKTNWNLRIIAVLLAIILWFYVIHFS